MASCSLALLHSVWEEGGSEKDLEKQSALSHQGWVGEDGVHEKSGQCG